MLHRDANEMKIGQIKIIKFSQRKKSSRWEWTKRLPNCLLTEHFRKVPQSWKGYRDLSLRNSDIFCSIWLVLIWVFFPSKFAIEPNWWTWRERKNRIETKRFQKEKHLNIRRTTSWKFCPYKNFVNQLLTEVMKLFSFLLGYFNRSKFSNTHYN